MKKRLLFSLIGAASAVACGSLGDANAPSTLAHIQGKLTGGALAAQSAGLRLNGGAPSTGPIRVAVVWRNAQTRGFNAAADVPVVAGASPFEFSLTLTSAPPVDVLITRSLLASPRRSSEGSTDVPPTLPSEGSSSGATPSSYAGLLPQGFSAEDLAADFAFAMGTLVAYRDNNGNGRLDLVDEDATVFLDEVVGINENLGVFWFQGTIPNGRDLRDLAGDLPAAGYNLARFAPCSAADSGLTEESPSTDVPPPSLPSSTPVPASSRLTPQTATPFGGSSCGRPGSWLTPSTPVEIVFSTDPRLSSYMCDRERDVPSATETASNGGSAGSSGGAPVPAWSSSWGNAPSAGYPSSTDPGLRCARDGRSFSYNHCEVVTDGAGLCRHPTSTCWGMGAGLGSSETAPPGWPCTAQPPPTPPECTTDQDCNDDPAVSALWGGCSPVRTCVCNAGFTKKPNGKCAPATDGGGAPDAH